MSESRTTKAKLNIIFSLLSQFISLICGLIVPGLMIRFYGSELYGATTSIAQFLSYIALIEGGIGGVARAALYKPLAENDSMAISYVLAEVKRFFTIIGTVFIGYVLVLGCTFKSISHIESVDWLCTFLLVLVISISTFAEYFIGISYSLLLQASQKTYITKLVSTTATVMNSVLVIVLVSIKCNLIIVKLISGLVFALRPIVLRHYVHNHYSLIKVKTSKEKKYLTQKWTALGQHLAYFIHNYTDVAVLTIFTNLKLVAVYSVYSMVVMNIQNLTVSFSTGMEALFGDMLAKKEMNLLHKTFAYYESIISVIAVFLFSVTTVLLTSFVKLYTHGVNDVNYIYPVFAVLITIASMLFCLRQPYHAMIMSAGHFKETKIGAYGEALLNISLSIILVHFLSITGVAIGTVIAIFFRFIFYAIYLSQNIFMRPVKLFIKRILVNMGEYFSIYILGKVIISKLMINGFLQWIIAAIIVSIIAFLIVSSGTFIFYKSDLQSIFKQVFKKHKP